MDGLSLFFGRKRRVAKRVKRSPGRKPRGGAVKKLSKSQAYVLVGKRKRKLHRGSNGGLYYRTKSGRHYVSKKVLKRKGHALSPKRRRASAKKALRRRRMRKLKQTKAAKAARMAYRKRKARKSLFGLW